MDEKSISGPKSGTYLSKEVISTSRPIIYNNLIICLVNLKTPLPIIMGINTRFSYENLGIAYLASTLRNNGFNAKIIDAQTMDMSDDDLIEEIKLIKPNIIGFSPISSTLQTAQRIINKIKESNPTIHVLLGGQLASLMPEKVLDYFPQVDTIIIGYGEETTLEVAEALSIGKSLKDIKGIYYRDKFNKIRKNETRAKMANLDKIPFPSRDALEMQLRNGGSHTARVISSRGCPNNCSFCTTPYFEALQPGPRWRSRSVENVIEEIKFLRYKYDIKTILFSDDNFIGSGEVGFNRARDIAKRLIDEKLNINFRILCRADSLLKDPEILIMMKKAGLERVILGVESGCESGLCFYNKKITVDQNKKAIKLLKLNNVALEIGFIMFHPYITFNELRANALFLKDVDQAVLPSRFFSRLALYPGSALIDRLNEDRILDEFNLMHPFNYKFIDKRIDLLANALNGMGSCLHYENLDLSVYKLELKILNIELILSNINHKFKDKSNEDKEKLAIMIEQYHEMKEAISINNFNFFMICIDLAENKWDAFIFDKEKKNFILKLNEFSRNIEHYLEIYLQELQGEIL